MALHYEKEHSNYKFTSTGDQVDESIEQSKFPSQTTAIKPVKKPKAESVFWPCSICGNTFSNFQRYQKHLKSIHKINDQQVLVDMEALKKVAVLSEYSQVAKK